MAPFVIYTTTIVLCWIVGITTSAQLQSKQGFTLTSPATLTATVGRLALVFCSEPGGIAQWYDPEGKRVPEEVGRDVRQAGPSSRRQLGLANYQPSRGGQYQCRTSINGTNSTLNVTFGTRIEGITVTRTVQGSSPALSVSWTAVHGSGITYTVCYSTTSGTQSDPPSGAKCSANGITGTSTTLSPLSKGTTYYIWVAAVSSDGWEAYSDIHRARIHKVTPKVGPPTLTKAAKSGRPALTVTWTAPQSDYSIIKYQIQYRRSDATSWSTKDVTSTSTTLKNLTAGTSYQVQVRAISDIGAGPYSDMRTQITHRVPSIVGPPTLTKTARSGRPALTVTWTVPQSDRPITKYQVQYRRSGAMSWITKAVTSSSTTLENLSAGSSYQVQVRAVSDVGTGPYSDMRTKITHQVPSKVGPPTLTKAARSGRPALTVTWTAPQSDRPITKYQVQYRRSGTTSWSTKNVTSHFTALEKLFAGTSYQVQVRAISNVGAGPYSDMRTQITHRVPSKVGPPTLNKVARSGRPALTVTWTAPQSDRPITKYQVQYRRSGAMSWITKDVTSRSTTLENLVAGTSYQVQVRAVSDVGTGPYSDVRTQITHRVPSKVGPPTLIKAARSGRPALTVTWTAPQSDRPITKYQVQYRRSGTTSWSTKNVTSHFTALEKLFAGTSYQVQVRAISNVGAGPYSDMRTQITHRVPSKVGPPTLNKVARSGRPALTVTWTAPQSDRPITKYQVQYRRSGAMSWITKDVTSRSTTLENLVAGTSYQVQVRAVSDVGTGPYSDVRTQITHRVPSKVIPPPVLTKTATAGRPSLRVTWTAPGSERRVIRYQVQYRRSGATSWTTKYVTSTSTTLENLTAGTSYQFYVRAVSDVGAGPFSDVGTLSTFQVPQQVTGIQSRDVRYINILSLNITWNRPSSEASILYYEVQYWEDHRLQPTVKAYGEQITLNGTVGRTYRVIVRAVSTVGRGPWSEADGPPEKPSNIIVTNYTGSLTMQWHKERETKYKVYIQKKGSPETITFKDATTPYNITGLESNTEYTVFVEAYNSLGSANGSKMGYTLPEAPSDLVIQVLSSKSIRVTWTTPPNAERLPLTYHVGYSSEFTGRMSTSTTELSLVLTWLHPFDEYTVTVESYNKGGRGGYIVRQATTLSAVPALAPVVTSPVEPRSRSALLQWSLPPKVGRNGIILQYIVKLSVHVPEVREFRSIRNITVPNDRPPDIIYLLTGLTPYTRYAWKVAAVNDAGVGVLTSFNVFTTLEDVPGPVSNLSYNITSNTSVVIIWSEPEEPNGVITGYDVVYGVYEEDNSTTVHVTEFTLAIENLIPDRPIEVLVSARTNIGEGGNVSKIFFTSEGAPTVKVQNVVTKWINDNSAVLVSWTPLTLHEARGFPLYVVTYGPSSLNRLSHDINSVTTTDSSVVIGGLDPTTSYSITVDVYTGNGTIKGSVTADIHNVVLPGVPSNYGAIAGALIAVLTTAVIIIIIVLVVILYRRKKKYSESFKPSKAENNKDVNLARVDMEMFPVEVEENIRDFSTPISKVNFAQHVTALHARSDEGFEVEYQTIVNDPNGVDDIAQDHRHKNRYLNIYTYNHSRVTLSVTDENGSDYINASYLDGYKVNKQYIAAQGPTRTTKADFIQMIWDHKSPVIVMLTRLTENGKPKCERYWNDELNTPLELSDRFTVTTTDLKSYNGYEMRTLSIKNVVDDSGKPHYVKHFYYTAWPDHGVPECPSSIVRFVQHVRRQFQGRQSPLVVHCSAGVGRTGTFIAIDTMMQRLEEKDDLNIYEFVTYMRTRRTFMVQNQDQYSFIHDAIADYITCGQTTLAAHELRRVMAELDIDDPHTRETGFHKQFNVLEQTSKRPSEVDATIFMKPAFAKKNRFKSKYSYSSGYLHLPGKTGGVGADYYNASFVDSFYSQKAFIAAQSPLTNTRGDLWDLVWSFKTPTIVLLCDFMEGEEDSCCKFWPDEHQRSMEFGNLSITFNDCTQFDGYQMLTFNVKDIKQKNRPAHPVTLFHFKEWPIDGGPPVDALLAMMGEIEKCQAGKEKPPIVMCNDGMGRTGVFTTIVSEIERVKLEGEVDIFNAVKSSRNKRPHMVCTVDQYRLCFELLQAYLDSFDTYANFKAV